MFNGWPAEYADIASGLTFQRTIATEIEDYLNGEGALTALILGASGVGKTTAARQLLLKFLRFGAVCWEHKNDRPLSVEHWAAMMRKLKNEARIGVLFVDEAHAHIHQINDLVDIAVREDNGTSENNNGLDTKSLVSSDKDAEYIQVRKGMASIPAWNRGNREAPSTN